MCSKCEERMEQNKIFVHTKGTIMNLKGSMSIEVARNELLFYRNINCITSSNGLLHGTGVHTQMSKKPLNISEEAAVQMPMKTVASLIVIVALGTMGYFQIIERLNVADTRIQIMEKDLEENTEFRIKWPRGQLGSLPADSEQFMMIEDLYKTTDKINKHVEDMALNKVNIQFLRTQMDKVLEDIEKLKDANREIGYKNGDYSQ